MLHSSSPGRIGIGLLIILLTYGVNGRAQDPATSDAQRPLTLNREVDGYRGIWYMNQPSGDQYVYKYSGGLGTYCAKHRPFAIYSPRANKTFFCYGGATESNDRQLVHMVSYFDHQTGTVPRPTMLLDKQTSDAHDNPVISIDDQGYVWIFSTSHGRVRLSYIHRSKRPYQVDEFELVEATRKLEPGATETRPINNFSYMQVWHRPQQGFAAFFTRYSYPAPRTICFMSSPDGVNWSHWQRLAAIEQGHYQISRAGKNKLATMFNMHPEGKGLNWRTNLYYIESLDGGETWQTIQGEKIKLPITKRSHPALVHDYHGESRNVYLKDLQFDSQDQPVMLLITSGGYQAGPKNDPRTWTVLRWTDGMWQESKITTSDNNYDFGELQLLNDRHWQIIAPTETGPQPYNPGGEVAVWESLDAGLNWKMKRQLTKDSPRNHTYVRSVTAIEGASRPHEDFVAVWADGHGRQPSQSSLFFSDREGNVYCLPRKMARQTAKPELVATGRFKESHTDDQQH